MFCLDYGMDLVSLESRDKEVIIRGLFNTGNYLLVYKATIKFKVGTTYLNMLLWLIGDAFWSSLTDTRIDLKWVWESTMTLLTETTYTNWFPGTPNTQSGNIDDCMMYNGEFLGYWGDQDCSTPALAVCEKYD